ncbi:MAG: toxin-antitoxin system YwqK family antitoxin [Bacteroidales bacterium]|nr:toxin-antitoxin system YwqK family antitoxin [Bacteroidales bacterium]
MSSKLKYILTLLVLLMPFNNVHPQENINQTGDKGLKQGHWIKRYPDGQIMYEAWFKDGKPTGEFKRYDEDGNLSSLLNYITGTDSVRARIYHPNGYIAARGVYYKQKKTGEWHYFSDYIEDHLLMKSNYINNLIDGVCIKYHWNGQVAEELDYESGIKSGNWKQYFNDGTLCLKAYYDNGKLEGEFLSWHPNGQKEIIGKYDMDTRTGLWYIYNNDGSLRKEIKYNNGIPENRSELIREETEYLDRLEKEGGKISDPEITGIIR